MYSEVPPDGQHKKRQSMNGTNGTMSVRRQATSSNLSAHTTSTNQSSNKYVMNHSAANSRNRSAV